MTDLFNATEIRAWCIVTYLRVEASIYPCPNLDTGLVNLRLYKVVIYIYVQWFIFVSDLTIKLQWEQPSRCLHTRSDTTDTIQNLSLALQMLTDGVHMLLIL